MAKKLQFKVSSAIKSIIGRDLITNDNVAIFELVKNSVDAGARRIDIVFELDSEDEPAIYIIDNGKGMSEKDITKKWMFLGYSAKREGTEDSKKQLYAGNKGVGRFSCDRLGGTLQLQTRVDNSATITQIDVDWGKFEKNALDIFTNIDIELSKAKLFDMPVGIKTLTKGVVLKITQLRDEESWTRKKLLGLHKNLATLIDPFGDAKHRFQIHLHCDRELLADSQEMVKAQNKDSVPHLVNGIVQNKIIDLLKDKTTWLHTEIKKDGFIYTELHDRGEQIYRIREPLNSDLSILRTSTFCSTIFFLNTTAKSLFRRRMSMASVQFGSLFLFKNGFRVYPVGEQEDDYWGLNRRKQQGHSRYLGTREIMGKINVNGSDHDFKESSSRDKGLIDTPASQAMHACVWSCIKKLEAYVVGIGWKDLLDKEHDTPERMYLDNNRSKIIKLVGDLSRNEDVEILEYNENLIGILESKSNQFEPALANLREVAERLDDSELLKKVASAEKVLKRAKRDELEALEYAEREETARVEAERATADALADKDILEDALSEEVRRNTYLVKSGSIDKEHLIGFIHQVNFFISLAVSNLKELSISVARQDGSEWEDINDQILDLKKSLGSIVTTSRYLTSANFRLNSGMLEGDLIAFIYDHLTVIAPKYTKPLKISSCFTPSDASFSTKFSPITIGMILDNILANSGKSRATKIDFNFTVTGKILDINICDDGTGLSSKIQNPEDIFSKGVTRTKGSGTGLYFCKFALEDMGGSIEYVLPENEKGFGLKIRLGKS